MTSQPLPPRAAVAAFIKRVEQVDREKSAAKKCRQPLEDR